MSSEIEPQNPKTPTPAGAELSPPGRRQTFDEAADATFTQYDEALRRLADAS